MSLLEAAILGLIQGFAEFLPISSSAHLLLAGSLLGIGEPMLGFTILLHAGTLLPVCVIFRREVLFILRNPFCKLTLLLALSTAPLVIVALAFRNTIDVLFGGVAVIPLAFVVTGVLLIFSDKIASGHKKDGQITLWDALLIGAAQAVAVIPGISRSGNTIAVALLCKVERKTAAKFSFLMSIVANLGATVLETHRLFSGREVFGDIAISALVVGFIVSAVTGYLAITYMLALIQKSRLRVFSYYLFALAGIVVLDALALGNVLFG